MKITANNLPALIDGLEDYNCRITGYTIIFDANKRWLDLERSTTLFDLETYLGYCVSFGYDVTIHMVNEEVFIHIANG